MAKEHERWMILKKKVDAFSRSVLFNEREIWWCSTGINIGHEQDGKGSDFRRPVLIMKKFNKSVFWAMPLTSSRHNKPYQSHVMFSGRTSQVILSQLRLVDEKRLISKIGRLSRFQFDEIRKALAGFLYPQALFLV